MHAHNMPPVPRDALLRRLRAILPGDCILTDTESQRPFECDALTIYRELPLLVVLPETVEQVQQVLRICHELAVPVVARGAGTGLCAGAMPHPEGVLLVLARLDRIVEVDPLARTARVQPGVSNLAISAAVAQPWFVLWPGPLLPDRLQHRRQCGGKLRRCALPQVRPDRPQHPGPGTAHRGG